MSTAGKPVSAFRKVSARSRSLYMLTIVKTNFSIVRASVPAELENHGRKAANAALKIVPGSSQEQPYNGTMPWRMA